MLVAKYWGKTVSGIGMERSLGTLIPNYQSLTSTSPLVSDQLIIFVVVTICFNDDAYSRERQ